jgi:hypothetical protein
MIFPPLLPNKSQNQAPYRNTHARPAEYSGQSTSKIGGEVDVVKEFFGVASHVKEGFPFILDFLTFRLYRER